MANIADGEERSIDEVLLFLPQHADHELQRAQFYQLLAEPIPEADVCQRPLGLQLQLLEDFLVDEAVQHQDDLRFAEFLDYGFVVVAAEQFADGYGSAVQFVGIQGLAEVVYRIGEVGRTDLPCEQPE